LGKKNNETPQRTKEKEKRQRTGILVFSKKKRIQNSTELSL